MPARTGAGRRDQKRAAARARHQQRAVEFRVGEVGEPRRDFAEHAVARFLGQERR